MTIFLRALALALVWVAVTGSASVANIVFGLILSALSLLVAGAPASAGPVRFRAVKVLSLALLFARELAMSALAVALLVSRPRLRLEPGIFAFRLTVTRDFDIALLSNLITLTPGTLTVDVSQDRQFLYIHTIDCSDPDGARRAIAEGFERRIMEAFCR